MEPRQDSDQTNLSLTCLPTGRGSLSYPTLLLSHVQYHSFLISRLFLRFRYFSFSSVLATIIAMSFSHMLKQSDGRSIPQLGFGVWESPVSVCKKSVLTALQNGYRHIDTAQNYGNEKEVGQAIREFMSSSKVPREDIYVTTKCWTVGKTEDSTFESLKASVEKIGLGYVDLFLVHTSSHPNGAADRAKFWRAMERLQEAGLTKSIGVSNYAVHHLKEIKDSKHQPDINQIELHPFCQQRGIVAHCKEHNIVVEAYSPIRRGRGFDHPVLRKLAEAHSVDVARVMLRWSVQKGYVPLPKSDTASRIESNADLFSWSLTGEEMAELDALDEGSAGAVTGSNTAVDQD